MPEEKRTGSPKPHAPSTAKPESKPSPKKPYIRREHLTNRPFTDSADLRKLQSDLRKNERGAK